MKAKKRWKAFEHKICLALKHLCPKQREFNFEASLIKEDNSAVGPLDRDDLDYLMTDYSFEVAELIIPIMELVIL